MDVRKIHIIAKLLEKNMGPPVNPVLMLANIFVRLHNNRPAHGRGA